MKALLPASSPPHPGPTYFDHHHHHHRRCRQHHLQLHLKSSHVSSPPSLRDCGQPALPTASVTQVLQRGWERVMRTESAAHLGSAQIMEAITTTLLWIHMM